MTKIKKTLKATQQQEMEQQMSVDLPSTTDKTGRKTSKLKGSVLMISYDVLPKMPHLILWFLKNNFLYAVMLSLCCYAKLLCF